MQLESPALIALKKGTQLIKYSRKGKPKFCPFRVSPDETTLLWYSHGEERNLKLSSVLRIIPGQRTAVFRRFLRPEKEYLSFSLIYNNGERSLDLICKDKVEAEVWLAGLKALISTGESRSRRTRSDISDILRYTPENGFVLLTVGGGFTDFTDGNGRYYSSLEVASEYFRSGADHISIGSDAVYAAEEYLKTGVKTGKSSLEQISRVYGNQAVVVSIDPRRVYLKNPNDIEFKVVRLIGPGPNGEDYAWYQPIN